MKPLWRPGILITGEPVEKGIEETYIKKSADASKQGACRLEGDLTRSLLKKSRRMACVAHLADGIANDFRECLKDLD
jgi:hypothetical protein